MITFRNFLILHFAFCIFHFSFAQQYGWTDISQYLPEYPYDTTIINNGEDTLIANLTGIYFINDQEGWVTTNHLFDQESGSILHTTDGGNTWEVQTILRSCQFIHMVDENVGYACSSGGMIYKTVDSGTNWVFHGITGTQITGISFPPGSDIGYVCSYATSKMHQVTPEGVNVINFNNSPFWWSSVTAPSHELIWLSASTSVYTYDEDGLTDQPITSDNYYSLYFIRNDLGWGCGSHGVKERNNGTIMGCVGQNLGWVVLSYTEQPLYNVFALDEDHLWAVGVEGYIYYSDNASDFGYDTLTSTGWSNVEFTMQTVPRPDANFRSVFFTSEHNGYASANENVLLKYGPLSGAGELARPDFELYPNPTTGQFKVQREKGKVELESLELIDLYGNILAKPDCQLPIANCELDISHLPAGIYFIRINLENQTIVKKIVKI